MKYLIAIVLLIPIFLFSQEINTFIDLRDSIVYKTVKIGEQVWMAENLRASIFVSGDSIPELKTNKEWRKGRWSPAWSSYKNDPENGLKYGYFYTRAAVFNGQLCPVGWRVPYYNDVIELQNYLGGETVAGSKMKSTSGWKKYNERNTNSSGFTALPSGERIFSGGFKLISKYTNFWTKTRNSQLHAVYLYGLWDDKKGLRLSPWRPDGGWCVRCIKE